MRRRHLPRPAGALGLAVASVTLRVLALPLALAGALGVGVETITVIEIAQGGRPLGSAIMDRADHLLLAYALLVVASLLCGVGAICGGVRRSLLAGCANGQ